jgi:hypothetical protein
VEYPLVLDFSFTLVYKLFCGVFTLARYAMAWNLDYELLSKFILNVILIKMKNILFVICAFALFSASLVSAAHAHVEKQSADQQIELSVDQDTTDNGTPSDPLCDMHCHNHMAQANLTQKALPKVTGQRLSVFSENATSSLIYGLKRPPKL